tara:strand:+ start:1048 stop:1239 length:192 start_codon:yes stop_codon:yes gene_type:complete
MLKSLIGTLLIFRLELRQLPLDPQWMLTLWRQSPAIEIVLEQGSEHRQQRRQLLQKLDEVYPF